MMALLGLFQAAHTETFAAGPGDESEVPGLRYKNVAKVSLTAAALKNITVQYERAVSRRISLGLTYRGMPENTIAYIDRLENKIGYDEVDFENIRNMKVTSHVITPEVRIYTGKSGTKGFYLAPYASFASHDLKTPAFLFEKTDDDGSTSTLTLPMTGKIRGISGGLMFGAQFNLGSRVTLDWWIIGASYGKADGNVDAISPVPVSQDWQEEIQYTLDQMDLPFVKYTSEVSSEGARVKINRPWAGVRGGLSIGFRF